MRKVRLPDGTEVAALGQGTWRLGEGQRTRGEEADALRLGIDLGMTLIDTAEMYGEGGAEQVVGEAIRGRRKAVTLVTKIYPHNATLRGTQAACERSLRRLRVDCIDIYLLHWMGAAPFTEVIMAFERLRTAGKIKAWGVSNLDAPDMVELDSVSSACVTNQVLYNPEHRGIEYDLIPWCEGHAMPIMAYSPIGQGGRLLRHRVMREVAERHGASPAQIAIAWSLRRPGVISIPKAGGMAHVRENAAAAAIGLTEADLGAIDEAFAPPGRKYPLAML